MSHTTPKYILQIVCKNPWRARRLWQRLWRKDTAKGYEPSRLDKRPAAVDSNGARRWWENGVMVLHINSDDR